jgi:hypothetical protein
MTYILSSYYFAGVKLAHAKLGTIAGPIPYAPTEDPEATDPTTDKWIQREFKGLDDHNSVLDTSKTADYIRGDLDKIKPQKPQMQQSTINQTFNTNDQIGEELGLGDPPATNPFGSDKVAFSNPLSGGSSPFKMPSLNIPGVKPLSQLTPKMPNMTSPGAGLKTQMTQDAHNMLGQNAMLSRAARGNGSPI